MIRSFTLRLYPNQAQVARLDEILELHRLLYNAALEQKKWAYRLTGKSPSLYDQQKAITVLRTENAEYKELDSQSLGMTLSRLDDAYSAFFRRIKSGETPGFPRFKGKDRFNSFTLRQSGWKLTDKHLKLTGVGNVRWRGSKHLEGKLKTCVVERKDNRWYAHITVEAEAHPREHGNEVLAFDWGLSHFLTIGNTEGKVKTVENPYYLRQSLEKLAKAQQAVARKKKGSRNRKRAVKKLARLYEKTSNQRKDFLHKQSATLVSRSFKIITEQLNVASMAASNRSTLNRSILDSAPGMFLDFIKYKAEEAGIEFVKLDTKVVKPTQTCSGCGHQEKKTLGDRIHECKKCGLKLPRDENSVQVMLKTFLKAWDEPTREVIMPSVETC